MMAFALHRKNDKKLNHAISRKNIKLSEPLTDGALPSSPPLAMTRFVTFLVKETFISFKFHIVLSPCIGRNMSNISSIVFCLFYTQQISEFPTKYKKVCLLHTLQQTYLKRQICIQTHLADGLKWLSFFTFKRLYYSCHLMFLTKKEP